MLQKWAGERVGLCAAAKSHRQGKVSLGRCKVSQAAAVGEQPQYFGLYGGNSRVVVVLSGFVMWCLKRLIGFLGGNKVLWTEMALSVRCMKYYPQIVNIQEGFGPRNLRDRF